MNRYGFYILLIFFGTLLLPQQIFAQQKEQNSLQEDVNKDDLGNVENKFQEYFFEALKQRAIENYEKAITALQKCEELRPGKGVVYFELGKNYKALKNYSRAEENLLKALAEEKNDQDILVELYDVYYRTQNYAMAIETAKKLVPFNIDYREDLANLYVRTQEYDLALAALDHIDAKEGQSDYRDALRRKIFNENQDTDAVVGYLKERIKSNPEQLQPYTNLIYVYSRAGNLEQAYQTALDLQKVHPKAVEAHLALYKMYRQEHKPEQAMASMKLILRSDEIDNESKERVIKDFTSFVQEHPEYESELIKVLGEELPQKNKSTKELANYYTGKDNAEALKYYKLALKDDPNNFELLKKTILLQVERKKYEEAFNLSDASLAVFPSQPIFYLLKGVSGNALAKSEIAAEALKNGLDFLVDDPKMEADFYKQLQQAFQALGNLEQAEAFKKKALKLQTPSNEN